MKTTSILDEKTQKRTWVLDEKPPHCANCGKPLGWFRSKAFALAATESPDVSTTADGEPAIYGRDGDNFTCGRLCAAALLVKLAQSVGPSDLLALLPSRVAPRERDANNPSAINWRSMTRAILLIGSVAYNHRWDRVNVGAGYRGERRRCHHCKRDRVVFHFRGAGFSAEWPLLCQACVKIADAFAIEFAPKLQRAQTLVGKRVVLPDGRIGFVAHNRGDYEMPNQLAVWLYVDLYNGNGSVVLDVDLLVEVPSESADSPIIGYAETSAVIGDQITVQLPNGRANLVAGSAIAVGDAVMIDDAGRIVSNRGPSL